jgi:ABC transport system ATP-binding/permease protein
VLISAFEVSKSFATKELFNDITFGIDEGDRIGLIGPNGAGKTTLLQILAGRQKQESGNISRAKGMVVGYLEQSPTFSPGQTVLQAVMDETDETTPEYPDYEKTQLAETIISKLDLDSPEVGIDRPIELLSGGWKKRVALARELVRGPQLLLLDEPTNHLDVESILWLENFLNRERKIAVLTVTHDRLFLQNTCNTIFDLDRRNPDGLIKHKGTYAEFLDFKEATLHAQENFESKRRNVLRRETEWLHRGAAGRQTKQKARIDRAGDISKEFKNLSEKNEIKKLSVDFGDLARSPKKMIEAINISKKYESGSLFKDLSLIIGPNTRLGLLGKNGCGKSTLIRALLGLESPDSGKVTIADGIKYAYFEQQKQSLNPNISVLKTICPEGDHVEVQGRPVFAKSYLSKFHFRPEQMDLPVGRLSGGEQSRLLIAELMMKSEPILVLDEPTNDLDVATLEVLQEALADFAGAVILVTHDRYFLDQVSNQILAFTGNDGETMKFADFFQWQEWYDAQKTAGAAQKSKSAEKSSSKATSGSSASPAKKVKLTFNEQRELEQMESEIQKSEKVVKDLQTSLASPKTASNYIKSQELSKGLQAAQKKTETLYARWQELSQKQSGAES